MISGVMYWVNMWVKEKQDGSEYFSFSVKPQDNQQRQAAPRQQEAPQRQSRRMPTQGQGQQPRQAPRQTGGNGFDDPDQDISW
jgi:hypothetical protein